MADRQCYILSLSWLLDRLAAEQIKIIAKFEGDNINPFLARCCYCFRSRYCGPVALEKSEHNLAVEENHKQICTLKMLLVLPSVQLKITKFKACDPNQNKYCRLHLPVNARSQNMFSSDVKRLSFRCQTLKFSRPNVK